MRHTPGPWTQSKNGRGNDIVAPRVSRSGSIATAFARDNVDEQTANARLIAAAPDLLSIAKTLKPVVLKYADPVTHGFLLAAIDKAEGR